MGEYQLLGQLSFSRKKMRMTHRTDPVLPPTEESLERISPTPRTRGPGTKWIIAEQIYPREFVDALEKVDWSNGKNHLDYQTVSLAVRFFRDKGLEFSVEAKLEKVLKIRVCSQGGYNFVRRFSLVHPERNLEERI